MRDLYIDIETYSSVSLPDCGLHKYMESPDFEILLLSYAFDDEPVKCIDIASGEEIPPELIYALTDTETVKHAWNAAFEYTAFVKYFNIIDITQWVDDMVVSLYHGFPASLGDAGKALGLPQDKQKDARGKRLIRLFSIPDKKKGRIMPKDKPEEWAEYKEYNIRDVETEREISNRVCGYGAFPVPSFIWDEWRIDRRINDTGVRLDMGLVRGALAISEEETTALKSHVKDITGLDNPNSVAQLKGWIEEKTGTAPESLDKAAVSELLSGDLPEEVREVLEIRQKLGKSSIAKYSAMVDCECADSRARGLFQFYGASHTGRFAGRLIQIQNLPRNYIESLGYARELVKAEDGESIKLMYGDVQDTLSQLLRTVLIPSEGCEFVIADYSAIECRVLAWLAGEESTLDAFRNGEDIYCHTASRMYGVPVVKHGENGELRQKGKQATLACGYGGGVNALRAMGAKGTDAELQPLVDYWRRANPNVVKYWAEVERAAKFAMRTAQPSYAKHVTFRYETDDKSGLRFLTCELPSGRKLFYCNPRFKTNRFGGTSIAYDAQRTAGWGEVETYGGKLVENCVAEGTKVITERGLVPIENVTESDRVWDGIEWVEHEGLISKGEKEVVCVSTDGISGIYLTPEHKILTSKGWIENEKANGYDWADVSLPHGFAPSPGYESRMAGRISIIKTGLSKQVYDIRNCGERHRFAVWDESAGRARIVSNCTQAVARDLLMNALENIEKAGYTVVSHVHDEVIVDAPRGSLTVDALSSLMCRLPEWADTSLPLEAAGFTSMYYMKD